MRRFKPIAITPASTIFVGAALEHPTRLIERRETHRAIGVANFLRVGGEVDADDAGERVERAVEVGARRIVRGGLMCQARRLASGLWELGTLRGLRSVS